jgi:hypothetical protein
MLMPRRNRQLPTVQLDLFRPSSPQSLDWLCLSAEVREKVTRLIARMLSKHEVCNRPDQTDGGHDDE